MINGKKIKQKLLRGPLALLALLLPWSFSLPADAQAALSSAFPPQTSGEGPQLKLRVGAFDPLTESIEMPARLQRSTAQGEAELYLVQFPGPVQESWYQAMTKAGLEIVTYIPDYGYLVWGNAGAISQMSATSFTRWSGPYHPYYALHPALADATALQDQVDVIVQVYAHPDISETLDTLLEYGTDVLRKPYPVLSYRNLGLRVAAADLSEIAALPGVVSVEPLPEYRKLDEVQGQIMAGNLNAAGSQPSGPGYLSWLTATIGFTTTPSAYPIVDITDDGIDNGSATPTHPDFYEGGSTANPDRLIYNYNWTSDPTADGLAGHGNINASIVGGYNDRSGSAYEDGDGYNYGLGLNPFGRIAGSKVFENSGDWGHTGSNADLIGNSYTYGARISTNSWGMSSGGDYGTDDQEYDALVRDALSGTGGNQEMIILFAAGNDGSGSNTTGTPGNAKNVLTVGAAENYRPTWTDGCDVATSGADNANDIIDFSSRGPTDDGRLKPEIVAPGTHIQGAASQTSGYDGTGVCDQYQPTGQTLYAASSGTSHSTPAVAGAASLFYRYYLDHFSATPPSPAMVKAYLTNSARYLDGVDAGDTLPSNAQGYGEVMLGTAFDDAARLLVDQTELLQATAESYTLVGGVADPSLPFRVTLAWTDAPGPTTGAAYVNNLDLEVKVNNQTYLGNVFSGTTSTINGSADPRNNIESVFLPAGTSGPFTITVKATNIAGDGLPGNGDVTDQDFALVCYNCRQVSDFNLTVVPRSLGICSPQDAVYTLTTTPILGFDEIITLDANGIPTGASSVWGANPVTSDSTTTLTIYDTHLAAAGSYPITVTALSPSRAHAQTVQLDLFDATPDTPTLLTPANTAENVSLSPTLKWTAASEATHYLLEIATDPEFSSLVYTATTTDLLHTPTTALSSGTTYYWRVTPENPCGQGIPSATFSFTTLYVFCNTPARSILDNTPTGVSDTLSIPDLGNLIDLNLAISVTHTWVGDLSAALTHLETGTRITLIDRPGTTDPEGYGCSGNNINVTLDDEATLSIENDCNNTTSAAAYVSGGAYTPNTPLSTFDDEALQGTWVLNVADNASGDTGTLVQWCMVSALYDPAATPKIAALPTEIIHEQSPDLQSTQVLTLSNSGSGTLTATVAEGSSDCSEISDLPWLAATPITGTLLPGTELPLAIQLDSTGLSAGSTYEGALCIYNNTPLTPLLTIPVTLQIPAPQIDVTPTEIAATQLPDLQTTQPLTLSNSGSGTLTATVTEGSPDCSEISDLPWLAAAPITGTLLPGTELPLAVQLDSTGLSAGSTYEGALCIYNNTPLTPVLSIPVTLHVPWAYTLNLPLVLRDYSEP